MSETNVTGVLIGAGYFARHHMEAWRRMPGVRIVAVADPAPGKAAEFAREFGIPNSYATAEELLDREASDFVDIVTRPELHLPMIRCAAERRRHVICQKPMAPTMEECLAMVETCESHRVRLMIHENWRWQPWYRHIRALIDAGSIGQPAQFSFHWRTRDGQGPEPYPVQPYFRGMPQLLVYETLVHLLDTFRYLNGELATVYCQNRRLNPAITGEDQSLIALTFHDGILGLIDANRLSGPADPGPVMGTMTIDGDSGRLRLSSDGHIWLSTGDGGEVLQPADIPTIGYKGDSVFATQAHLIQSLVQDVPSESDGRDYLRTVAAMFACYESTRTGQVIRLAT
jgi:predicted dehydrogenase